MFYEAYTDARLMDGRMALEALLNTNPRAVASKHVQHNIGKARREWLAAYVAARAGALASS